MKRILILLLTVIFSANLVIFGTVYGAEDYSYKYGDMQLAKDVTEALDIISYTEETANDVVSRIDFAIFLARLLKIDEYADADEYYFTDVDTSHYGCAAVNALCEMGIISQNEERSFYPDSVITRAEISKMILVMLGYKDYAEVNGGYPAGYLKLSERSKIFCGIDSGNDSFTVSEAALIIMNAASVAMYTPKIYGTDTIEYAVNNGSTIFSLYHNLYVELGTLKSVGYVSLIDEQNAGQGKVLIGNNAYITDKNYEENLGEKVYAYYFEASDGERKLLFIRPSDSQNVVSFDSDHYHDFKDNVFSYYDDEERLIKRKTDNNTVFVKNGKVLLYDIEDEAKIDYGRYKLIDNDKNGIFETVLVEETETFVVGTVDYISGAVYDKEPVNEPIYIQDYINGTVAVYDSNGNETSFETIAADDVLSVVRYKDEYLKIIISRKTETAVIKSVNIIDHAVIDTGENVYQIADTFADYDLQLYRTADGNLAQRFELGTGYILRFDVYGRVAYVSNVKASGEYIIGYIIDVKNDENGFDGVLALKLLCEDKNIYAFDCTENLKIDGVKTRSAKEAFNNIINANRVIRFKINDNNEIFDIDTSEYKEGSESEFSLRCTREYDRTAEALTYMTSTNLFGAANLADTSTIIFNVPAAEQGAAERDYSLGTLSQFMDSTGYNIEAYKIGTEPGAENIIVYRQDGSKSDETVRRSVALIVDEIVEVINADGICAKRISGYQQGAYVSMIVEEDFDSNESLKNCASDKILTLDDIKRGDIIKVGRNNFDEIDKIQYYVDGENLDETSWAPIYGTFIDRGRQELAYCLRRNGTIIEWSYSPGGEIAGIIDLKTSKVVVYDADNSRIPFSVGTANDIVSYEAAGTECSRLYIGAYVSRVNTVIVYK